MGWKHGKSVGGLFEKVSNSLLLTDIHCTNHQRNQDNTVKWRTLQISRRTLCSIPCCYVVITKLRTLETARIRSTVLDFYSADDVSSAKNVLMEAVSYVQLDKPLSRYPERQSTDRTVREMDDVMDILVQIDERKLLSALPSFVADNSDNLSSSRMDDSDMHTILNKIDKLEAILFGVQTAVYIVRIRSLIRRMQRPNRIADFLTKRIDSPKTKSNGESECSSLKLIAIV